VIVTAAVVGYTPDDGMNQDIPAEYFLSFFARLACRFSFTDFWGFFLESFLVSLDLDIVFTSVGLTD
jgi:hypothetical protein